MVRYLLKRLGRGILTILLSVTLVFFIVRAMPSNPVDLMVSPQMSEEAQQALIEEFGLDQSKLTQYGLYMKELLHGNLGSSFAKRIPVSQYIAEKLPWTLLLLAAVMLIVILVGISVGLYAAAHKGKISDRVISVLVTMGISVFIPFMAFLLLYLFSFKLKLLPTGGAYTPPKGTGWSYYGDVAKHLILPAIALSITNLANAVLYTPEGRAMIKKDNYTFAGPKDKVYIVNSDDPHLENRSVRDIAQERGIDEDECMLDLLGDEKNYVFWLNAPAANVPSNFIDHCESIVKNPYVSVGSDTIMGDPADPYDWYEIRRRGGFAIFAQMYVGKGVPYEEVVRRNTSMVADHFGIYKRGRLVEGNYADIAVIDLPNYRYPEMDQMQYKTPQMNATGCDLVLCNGKVELKDGDLLRTYAGRVLRKNAQG